MTENINNKAQEGQSQSQKMTNKQMEHELKICLIRECEIYGKKFKEAQKYFHDKGIEIGHTQWKALRKEIRSARGAQNWFTDEALIVLESDHKLSLHRTLQIENGLVDEIFRLQKIENKSPQEFHMYIKSITQFESMQETKTKMFSATPMIQEIMAVHEQQKEEQDLLKSQRRAQQIEDSKKKKVVVEKVEKK